MNEEERLNRAINDLLTADIDSDRQLSPADKEYYRCFRQEVKKPGDYIRNKEVEDSGNTNSRVVNAMFDKKLDEEAVRAALRKCCPEEIDKRTEDHIVGNIVQLRYFKEVAITNLLTADIDSDRQLSPADKEYYRCFRKEVKKPEDYISYHNNDSGTKHTNHRIVESMLEKGITVSYTQDALLNCCPEEIDLTTVQDMVGNIAMTREARQAMKDIKKTPVPVNKSEARNKEILDKAITNTLNNPSKELLDDRNKQIDSNLNQDTSKFHRGNLHGGYLKFFKEVYEANGGYVPWNNPGGFEASTDGQIIEKLSNDRNYKNQCRRTSLSKVLEENSPDLAKCDDKTKRALANEVVKQHMDKNRGMGRD